MTEPEYIKDFGFLNGYSTQPDAVLYCEEMEHKTEGREIGRCTWEHTCRICKISWTIDSSD